MTALKNNNNNNNNKRLLTILRRWLQKAALLWLSLVWICTFFDIQQQRGRQQEDEWLRNTLFWKLPLSLMIVNCRVQLDRLLQRHEQEQQPKEEEEGEQQQYQVACTKSAIAVAAEQGAPSQFYGKAIVRDLVFHARRNVLERLSSALLHVALPHALAWSILMVAASTTTTSRIAQEQILPSSSIQELLSLLIDSTMDYGCTIVLLFVYLNWTALAAPLRIRTPLPNATLVSVLTGVCITILLAIVIEQQQIAAAAAAAPSSVERGGGGGEEEEGEFPPLPTFGILFSLAALTHWVLFETYNYKNNSKRRLKEISFEASTTRRRSQQLRQVSKSYIRRKIAREAVECYVVYVTVVVEKRGGRRLNVLRNAWINYDKKLIPKSFRQK